MKTINTKDLNWNKNTKTLMGDESVVGVNVGAREVYIKSNVTGRTIKFVYDQERAIENEFWDGVMCEYIPVEDCNVKKFVLMGA